MLCQTPAEFCLFSGAFPLALGAICAAKAVPSSRSESASANRQNSKAPGVRSEEHTSELQSLRHLVCRLLLEKKKTLSTLLSAPSRAFRRYRDRCKQTFSPQISTVPLINRVQSVRRCPASTSYDSRSS